ncbi:MAG: DUF4159 domain-containing protein [Rhodobacter sp.]|nr:DUF4159 domain-containing protein [Rhodobacter sp.]
MFSIAGIGFAAPWLLVALAGLPVLWLLLRAVPPAPVRRRFPGVTLLLGLADDETQTDRTPWWLLLLRMLAVASLIVGFAGPVLNSTVDDPGTGPLLVLVDGTWADAPDWNRRIERIDAALADAALAARPVALARLTEPPVGEIPFQAADALAKQLPNLTPNPWEPEPAALERWAANLTEERFDTLWVSDGLDRESRAELLRILETRGTVTVMEDDRPVFALRPATFGQDGITVSAVRSRPGDTEVMTVVAKGVDPRGVERQLASVDLEFAEAAGISEVTLSLPAELRDRISRFEIAGIRSAGAVSLTDDALRRREIALVEAGSREGPELMSPLHYLERALEPTTDMIRGALPDLLPANPDVIVLADVATVSAAERRPVLDWIERGGTLLRFAGPRLAASDVSRRERDPLLPVRLRAGGRAIGGAMSWGEPKVLRAFPPDSPFFGLSVPEDVRVSSQLLAQPGPDLAERVIASLADGTPLVTRERIGRGQVVLFHVTANAEWSTLPLSGLFVRMLERLAVSTRPSDSEPPLLRGTVWSADVALDAFGTVADASRLAGVSGDRIADGGPGPGMPPGLYSSGERRVAVNVIGADASLSEAVWPERLDVLGLDVSPETVLKGWFLALAVVLLALDVVGSLWLTGRLVPASRVTAVMLGVMLVGGVQAEARSPDEFAMQAASRVSFGYVSTGDRRVDSITRAGLKGLSDVLRNRTSVEPGDPVSVDLESDELSVFPLLYWPVTPMQKPPSDAAYDRLNRFLRGGGMIVFDTLDADIAGYGQISPNGRRLRELTLPLDIPPLELLPSDHVLTRAFYLLQDFPGRHSGREVWVEAAPTDARKIDGMPFRNLNDNVTPVLIGGNDWASAWAVDEAGNEMFPVGRGMAGERQRELARRFGVNLVMNVLTGNYKSDQVHVPALLDRLGQ